MTNLVIKTIKEAIVRENSRLYRLPTNKRYEIYCNANSRINRLKILLKRVYITSLNSDLTHSNEQVTVESFYNAGNEQEALYKWTEEMSQGMNAWIYLSK
jgi:hypothetical protein